MDISAAKSRRGTKNAAQSQRQSLVTAYAVGSHSRVFDLTPSFERPGDDNVARRRRPPTDNWHEHAVCVLLPQLRHAI